MSTAFQKNVLTRWGMFGVVLAAIALLLFAGHHLAMNSFEAKLRAAIQRSARGEIQTFAMESLTDFPWDGLHIFGPYTPVREIDKALGFTWPGAKDSGIEMSDTFCLLVFTHNKRVSRYYQYPRRDGDWPALIGSAKISPASAVFSAKEVSGVPIVLWAGQK